MAFQLVCVVFLWLVGLIWRFGVGFSLGDLVLFATFWVLVLVLFCCRGWFGLRLRVLGLWWVFGFWVFGFGLVDLLLVGEFGLVLWLCTLISGLVSMVWWC